MKKPSDNQIIFYQTPDGPINISVLYARENVRLTQKGMAELFDINRSVITKHLKNIFIEKELENKSVCAKFAHTAKDEKTYKTKFYSLEAIVAVGYRVNSEQGTQFRQWVTRTLKNHLVKGYTINEKRLLQTKNQLKELQNTMSFLQEKSKHKLLAGQEQEILNLLAGYSKTLRLLEQYDKEKLKFIKKARGKYVLRYEDVRKIIKEIKREIISKKEASDLFGQENSEKFKGIIGNIYQIFKGKELYCLLEEKAAHLLYFVIKDHPFVDDNKRIGLFTT